MRKMLFAIILCAAVTAAPATFAADQPIDFHAQGARVHSSLADGGALTLPSQAAAADVAKGFLAERHAGRTLDSLVVTGQFDRDGITFVRLGQQVDGLDVYGTYVRAAVNQNGELVHLIENLDTPPVGGLPSALIGPADALSSALAANHPGHSLLPVSGVSGNTTSFANDGFFWRDPTATLVAIPMRGTGMQQGFLVETWENESNLLYHTLVGRTGRVLGVELRTNDDSYNIFPDHPGNSTQTITAGPGAGNAESQAGWLFAGNQLSIHISGNNTDTYLDTDASNGPDAGGAVISDGNFLTVWNGTQEPEVFSNQEVAVQNLFYLCNRIHDKLYHHGFVEATGNFQDNNFGNGGAGGDPVLCEAQDGSGTNNANFSTPSDGSSGRMQMYVWTLTSPKRDGDLDSDIPWHEYGHGLTWRMIGGMSGPLSGAVGEGNGDVLSILTNNDDVVGEYSFNDPLGIRSEPYDNYSRTYGDFGGEVHLDGEIYAATLWDLKKRYEANGLTIDDLWDDMVGGMNFTPSGPAFEDMRDGILAQAPASRDCLIWESFAQFGVGVNASGSTQGGGPFGGGKINIHEDFTVPPECSGCVVTESPEVSCNDGIDNDCDGAIDAADSDCNGGGVCTAGQKGDSCNVDADCCSGKCRGPAGSMTCK
jgi:extracellular elastinolytic metalloproteinase